MTKKGKHGYRESVEYVALNDEPSDLDVESVAGFISTDLVAFIFGKEREQVASDIVRYREKLDPALWLLWKLEMNEVDERENASRTSSPGTTN